MIQHDDFAHDVVFLFISSLSSHCEPVQAQAHDLKRVAVQAHLPVLRGAFPVLSHHPEPRSQAHELLRHLASVAPRNHVLDIDIGGYRVQVDSSAYAAAFPDSYFDPARTTMPSEFAGA